MRARGVCLCVYVCVYVCVCVCARARVFREVMTMGGDEIFNMGGRERLRLDIRTSDRLCLPTWPSLNPILAAYFLQGSSATIELPRNP